MVEIDDLADVVMQAIETATAPLIARIASLEKRQLVHGRDGRDGKDASVDLDTLALKAAELVPRPKDGKDAPAVDLEALATKAAAKIPPPRELDEIAIIAGLQASLDRSLAKIPKPQDGKDGASVDPSVVEAMVTKAVAALPAPKDGKDVDAAMLEVIVAAHVERAVAAIPRPLDGKSLSPMDVEPLIQAEVAKAARAGQDGRDGIGVAGAVIDHAGVLRLTLTDGKSVECGPVRGKDADMAAVQQMVADEVALIPTPTAGRDGVGGQKGADGMNGKDGRDGKDGADGLGFDDLDVFMDEEKGAIVRFKQGERVKDFPMPWLVDRGVYVAGKRYHKGASVTAQGSIWTAQADTRARPGDGSKDWRLAVKRGRDGKDAVKEPSDG